MTENKRFWVENERILNTYVIRIFKEDEIIFEINNWNSLNEGNKVECEGIANELNNLSDEKEKLQFELKECYDRKLFSRRELKKENKMLKKENEQLKQQLLCDGDDVCYICKHKYLIPSNNYFIMKCIKGHEECSKEDIKYCEDFEFKGDKPDRVTWPKKLEKKSAEKRYYALLSEGCIYPEFFDGGNDDLLMETEEVEDLLNEYEQLKQGINDLAQKFQDDIKFDKKQGITQYPIELVSSIINYFKEGI